MPFLAIGLKLLGIGKSIFGFLLGVLKVIAEFANKHPVLFAAIVLDLVLLSGCYWGYRQHNKVLVQQGEIDKQKTTISQLKTDNSTLSMRLGQYSKALADAQRAFVNEIYEHNKEVDNLKKAADEQLRRAQEEAAKTRRAREQYAALSVLYRQANPSTGTAEQRIAREEATNRKFISDFRKVK